MPKQLLLNFFSCRYNIRLDFFSSRYIIRNKGTKKNMNKNAKAAFIEFLLQ